MGSQQTPLILLSLLPHRVGVTAVWDHARVFLFLFFCCMNARDLNSAPPAFTSNTLTWWFPSLSMYVGSGNWTLWLPPTFLMAPSPQLPLLPLSWHWGRCFIRKERFLLVGLEERGNPETKVQEDSKDYHLKREEFIPRGRAQRPKCPSRW